MAGHPGLLDPAEPLPAPATRRTPRGASGRPAGSTPYVEYLTLRTLLGGVAWPEWEPGLRDREPAQVPTTSARRPTSASGCGRSSGCSPTSGGGCGSTPPTAASCCTATSRSSSPTTAPTSGPTAACSARRRRPADHRDRVCRPTTSRPTASAGTTRTTTGPRWRPTAIAWWRRRIARQRDLFDLVRIDHFRGFEAAWHVPVDAPTAKDGWWAPGPGLDLLAPGRRRRRAGLAGRRGPRRDHPGGGPDAARPRAAGHEGAAVRLRRRPRQPAPARPPRRAQRGLHRHPRQRHDARLVAVARRRHARPGPRPARRPRRADALGPGAARATRRPPGSPSYRRRTCSGSAPRPG